jgi:hypothetical protein
MNDFSYSNYRRILRVLNKSGRIATFDQVLDNKLDQFIVIRHDIEFSIAHAWRLAKIEKKMGIKTTYLVQLRNPIYNPLAKENLKMLQEIKSLGHKLGLHYYCDKEKAFNKRRVIEEINQDIKGLSLMLQDSINIFSIHRPNDEILLSYLKIPGLINCYGRKFFYYWPKELGPVQPQKLPIVYLSDSNNKWKFGKPVEVSQQLKPKKLHLLFHPYSWNEKNLNDQDNLRNLFRDKVTKLDQSYSKELKNYRSNSLKWSR